MSRGPLDALSGASSRVNGERMCFFRGKGEQKTYLESLAPSEQQKLFEFTSSGKKHRIDKKFPHSHGQTWSQAHTISALQHHRGGGDFTLKDLIVQKRELLKHARSVKKDKEARDFLKGLESSHSSIEEDDKSSVCEEEMAQIDQERMDPMVQSSVSDPAALLERLGSEPIEPPSLPSSGHDMQRVKMLEQELKESEQIHRTCFDDLASEYDALKRKLDLLEAERKQEKQEVQKQLDGLEDAKRKLMSERSAMECKLMNAHREIDGLKEKLAQALDDHDRARSLLIRLGEKCFNPSSMSADDGISHDLLYHLDRMKRLDKMVHPSMPGDSEPPFSFPDYIPQRRVESSEIESLKHEIKQHRDQNQILQRVVNTWEEKASKQSKENGKKVRQMEHVMRMQQKQLFGCVRRIEWMLEERRSLEKRFKNIKEYAGKLEDRYVRLREKKMRKLSMDDPIDSFMSSEERGGHPLGGTEYGFNVEEIEGFTSELKSIMAKGRKT
eukprot:TRINITY_DN1203_c1_g2_i1.p2 TRINITY_DN1203_c1_g2~~TRINITY_DN1203_c1_g2_i1.p2  ORF type:complete len:498 (+),score=164.40 TRINITY_DN1203_c1_g2_i1:148-1641(+)